MKRAVFCWLLCIFWSTITFAESQSNCPFCNERILQKQFVHESKHTVVLYCLTPATKGNLLIIPKRHIETFSEISSEEMLDIQQIIQFFAEVFDGLYHVPEYVLIQKNGKLAGQSVAHLHFHMIPAPKDFQEIVLEAFLERKRIDDEEMTIRTKELREYLCDVS